MKPLLFLFLLPGFAYSQAITANGPSLAGEEITCHMPPAEHLQNKAGRDGLGLCVFTSIDLAAKWANEPALIGLRDYMTAKPGGGWPQRVDQIIPEYAASRGLPTPRYLQHTGGDVAFLKKAIATGRYACVTYAGSDGVFYRGGIHHMVNLVHLTDKSAVIQDNNFPGRWLWLPTNQFLSRWRAMNGGWAVVLLKAGPPPIPVNNPQALGKASSLPIDDHTQTPEPYGAEAIHNFGVIIEKAKDEPAYHLNGKPVTQAQALAAFGDDLPDDAAKARLTAVGEPELLKRVQKDWESAPELAPWREKLHFQGYAPDNWAVKEIGFAPGVSLQPAADAKGKAPVTFRFRDYPGPGPLATALRKADPGYNPSKDVDPSMKQPVIPPSPSPSPDAKPLPSPNPMPDFAPLLKQVPPGAWILGGLVLLTLLIRNKETVR